MSTVRTSARVVLLDEEGSVLLLCATDGRIAWVIGYRIAEPFKVTGATRRVLQIRFQG